MSSSNVNSTHSTICRIPTDDEFEAWIDNIHNSLMQVEYRYWAREYLDWTEVAGTDLIDCWVADIKQDGYSDKTAVIARDAVESLSRWLEANIDGDQLEVYQQKREQQRLGVIREEHEAMRAWMQQLQQLMDANPDLPIEIAGLIGIGSGISWMNGYEFCEVGQPKVATVARGMDSHMIRLHDDGITDRDEWDPPEEELKWYQAIVVPVY